MTITVVWTGLGVSVMHSLWSLDDSRLSQPSSLKFWSQNISTCATKFLICSCPLVLLLPLEDFILVLRNYLLCIMSFTWNDLWYARHILWTEGIKHNSWYSSQQWQTMWDWKDSSGVKNTCCFVVYSASSVYLKWLILNSFVLSVWWLVGFLFDFFVKLTQAIVIWEIEP